MSAKEKIEQALQQHVRNGHDQNGEIRNVLSLLPEYEAEIRRECYERAAKAIDCGCDFEARYDNKYSHRCAAIMRGGPCPRRLSDKVRALAEGETEHGR